MKLKPLKRGKNRWCGPAVTSFITGMSTDEAGQLYRQQNPGRNATGMSETAVRKMLRTCGYWTTPLVRYSKKGTQPTLAKWLRDSQQDRVAGKVFLIIAGNHWQIVTGRRYACGIVGDIVSIKHPKVKRRARVAVVYEVEPLPDAAMTTAKVQRMLAELRTLRRQKTSAVATLRRRAHSLAAEWGIDIEVDDFGGGNLSIYCFPPQWFQDLREEGEIDIDIVAYSWDEAVSVITDLNEAMEEARVKRAA